MPAMRFVERQAKFTTAFVNRGLIAEHGSSWVLQIAVPPKRWISSGAAANSLAKKPSESGSPTGSVRKARPEKTQ